MATSSFLNLDNLIGIRVKNIDLFMVASAASIGTGDNCAISVNMRQGHIFVSARGHFLTPIHSRISLAWELAFFEVVHPNFWIKPA